MWVSPLPWPGTTTRSEESPSEANSCGQFLSPTERSCWLECPALGHEPPRVFFRNLRNDFRARRYFVKLTARSRLRMLLFYFISIARYLYLKSAARGA